MGNYTDRRDCKERELGGNQERDRDRDRYRDPRYGGCPRCPYCPRYPNCPYQPYQIREEKQ